MRIAFATLALALFCLAALPHPAAAEIVAGKVTFLTSRSLYVACDRSIAVSEGDTVSAGSDPGSLAPSVVKAVSRGSIVLERTARFEGVDRGSAVFVELPGAGRNTAKNAAPRSAGTRPGRTLPTVSGHAAFQYQRYRTDGGAMTLDQPSFSLDTRVSGISGLPLSLNARLRTRFLNRGGDAGSKSDRIDRLYDLSVEYGRSGGPLTISAGRLRTVRSAHMGGLDGLAVERRIARGFSAGAFGGKTPALETLTGGADELKRGAYLRWNSGAGGAFTGDATVSYIAENRAGRPSVHLLGIEQSLSRGADFSMNAEASINLHPRGDGREGETLQNLRAYVWYAPVRSVRLSGSWFAYLVDEYRGFTIGMDPMDALRVSHSETALPVIEFLLPHRIRLSGETLFERTGGGRFRSISSAARINTSNILGSGLGAGLSQVETRRNGSGHHTILRLSRAVGYGISAQTQVRREEYSLPGNDRNMRLQMRMGAFGSGRGPVWWSADYTRSTGNSMGASEVYLECGLRFGSGR